MPTKPDSPSFFDWLRGKRTSDINLPAENEKPDPRLQTGVTPFGQFKKAFKAGKTILAEPDALTGLRKAGQ